MIRSNVDRFWSTAHERLQIAIRRVNDRPLDSGYWTDDPIFRAWRFCNTYREDDKTTKWFRKGVRGFMQHRAADVLAATVQFRWFNRIETGEKIQHLLGHTNWNTAEARKLLTGVSPVVTGAYIIKTPNGMTKLEGVLQCIDNVMVDVEHLAANLDHCRRDEMTIQGVHERLMEYPYLGSFMAYQICSDLVHTTWLREASDAYTWAAMGPGSTRGCGWLEHDDPDHYGPGQQDANEMLDLMRELVGMSFQRTGSRWTMQQIQHWLCEYDKYTRASKGQDQKRRFPHIDAGSSGKAS